MKIIDPPFYDLTTSNQEDKEKYLLILSEYGNIFTDFDQEECQITKWKTGGWRRVEDGVSGGTTIGSFTLCWKDGEHFAINSGVKDGHYQSGSLSLKDALKRLGEQEQQEQDQYQQDQQDQQDQVQQWAYCGNEINYHDDGSQLFISLDHPIILLVGKSQDPKNNDDIKPEDFRVFLVPGGMGVNINAGIWHSAPFAFYLDKQVNMLTKQGKVHSKIYYYPLKEDQSIFRFKVDSV